MDLKIINKQDNPLLSRMEMELEAVFSNEATPKKGDIKKSIATTQKADEKLVVVKDVYGDFGAGKADVLVYIYKSEDELKKVEPQKKEKKDKPAEGAKKEAPKKGAPKEEAKEAPKEKAPEKEKKEESPKEEAKKE